MRIAVLTSLYPSAVRPFEGIFAERRWQGMLARGHGVRVVQPLPRAPALLAPLGRFGRKDWDELRATPALEHRGGIEIRRPRYLHVPKLPRRNARAFASLGVRTLLEGQRPEVVVADYAWPAGVAAAELARAGLACVISGRGSDVLQVAGEAGLGAELAAALTAAGHWCAVSQDLVDAMDGLAGQPGAGVLVPNGVDLELFAPRERSAVRRELELSDDRPLVLVVGHLIARKDPLLALATLVELRRARPGTRVCFVGDGPLRGELLSAVAAADLGADFHWMARAEPAELARWYAAADALLLTSWREGRPNVVLEALASGRPVLATEAGGTAELLEGLDGMLARTREAPELARALGLLLERGWSAAELRAHVSRFSWDAGLDSLERCLQAALS